MLHSSLLCVLTWLDEFVFLKGGIKQKAEVIFDTGVWLFWCYFMSTFLLQNKNKKGVKIEYAFLFVVTCQEKNQTVPFLQRAYVAVTPETRHYQDWEGLSYLQGPNANFYPKEGHQSR